MVISDIGIALFLYLQMHPDPTPHPVTFGISCTSIQTVEMLVYILLALLRFPLGPFLVFSKLGLMRKSAFSSLFSLSASSLVLYGSSSELKWHTYYIITDTNNVTKKTHPILVHFYDFQHFSLHLRDCSYIISKEGELRFGQNPEWGTPRFDQNTNGACPFCLPKIW